MSLQNVKDPGAWLRITETQLQGNVSHQIQYAHCHLPTTGCSLKMRLLCVCVYVCVCVCVCVCVVCGEVISSVPPLN